MSRRSSTSTCPLAAARWAAVRPRPSTRFTPTPAMTNVATTSAWPASAAWCSAAGSQHVLVSMLAVGGQGRCWIPESRWERSCRSWHAGGGAACRGISSLQSRARLRRREGAARTRPAEAVCQLQVGAQAPELAGHGRVPQRRCEHGTSFRRWDACCCWAVNREKQAAGVDMQQARTALLQPDKHGPPCCPSCIAPCC